jgi:4-amino-4-deoxy-L-arabinose transferase-like glycosyltransferase
VHLTDESVVDDALRTQDPSQTNSAKPAIRIGLALLIGASIVVRFLRLGSRELWLDEIYSALLANMPLKHMLQYTIGDVHPPLFYVLLWSWVRLVGDSEAALRLFSVVLFSVGIVGFFFVAREWLGTRSAAFATSLFALSPTVFVYSLEVRMYMLIMCAVIIVLVLHRIVTSETNRSWFLLVLYSLAAALVYYTHYIGVFLVVAFFLDWLILARFRPERLLRLGFAGLLTLALIAPWMPVMFHQRAQRLLETRALTTSYEDPTALTFHEAPAQPTLRKELPTYAFVGGVAFGLYPSRSAIVRRGSAFAIGLALLGVLYLALKGDRVCRLFVITGVFLLAGIALLGLTQPRYFLPILPLLFLAMARAFQVYESLRWPLLAKGIGALVLLLYAAGFVRQVTMTHPRPWSQLVASLAHSYHPRDIVIFDVLYGQVVFDYYARQAGFHPREFGFPESVYGWWERQPFKGWAGPVAHKSDLESMAAMVETSPKSRTVWLVLYELSYYDPQDALRGRLSRMGNTVELEYTGRPRDPELLELVEFPRLVAIRGPEAF